MIRTVSVLTAAVVAAAFTFMPDGSAGAEPAPPKKVATVEGITEYRFDNGLRLLLFPDPSTPKVTVNMTVLVGSRHEGYGETGMAHLLEHMVFKGTPDHPDIDDAMKARGAQFNGSTSADRTNYFETLPASDDNLEFAVGLEADRLVNSRVSAEDLRTEFSVVRNEFESGENSPQRVLNQRMAATAFEWHNYGKSTIGNRSDIERVPVERLRAFYRKYYQPDNVVVVVAGRFDPAKALAVVSRTFGAIPKPERTLDDTYTEEPPQDGERVVTLRRVGDTPIVGLMYHVPAAADPEHAALQVLAGVLSAQPSGRLYKALVETKKAASVFATAQGAHDPGTFEVMANLPRGGADDDARDAMLDAIEAVKEKGVTREEVDRARRQILVNRELAATDANQTAVRLSQAIAEGDWRLYFLERDRVEAVTPEQVRQVARKYLTRSNRTVGVFVPTTSPERTPVPPRPDVATLVEGYKGRDVSESAESFDVAPLAIEARVQRPDPIEGVKIVLLPKKTRGNTVQVHLTLHYGSPENLKGLTAAAGFLPELMTRGTKKLNRQQIRDALDENVARLGTGGFGGGRRGGRGGGGGAGTPGQVTFTVETKRAKLPAVLEILRQVVREPSLPADEFELMKVQRLAGLEQGRTDPARLAANRLQRLLETYPEDDVRYVPTVDEEIQRVKAATVEQVRTLYNDYLGASHGELAMVGDFEPSEVLPVVARMLEGWTSGKPYARIERPYQRSEAKSVREAINTPDKANAVYVAGLVIPVGDEHPDYPALVAGNFILGGGSLSSRLGDRLRQKEGLSYGAGSNFNASPLDARATLLVQAIANPENAPKVVKGVDEEVARLLADGVTPRELDMAKTGFARQQQVRRSNDAALAAVLANNLYLGRTMRFEAALERAIDALSPEVVNTALRKHIDPKRVVVVVGGDFKSDVLK